MSLTGGTLPTLLILASIGLFAALVFGWPKISAPWGAALQRAVAALLLNVTVLATAGALLNDQYLFYVSWSDLFGATAPATTNHHGATAAQAAYGKVKGRGVLDVVTPQQLPDLPSPGTRTQTYTVTGVTSGITAEVKVYLPAGYDPHSSKTYPVLVALHGYPGSPDQALRGVDLTKDVDKAVAGRQMVAPIVVAPQINTPRELDTECVNAPGGLQTETWLAQDVPYWIATHFRVDKQRTGWATFGFSFGGWCAAMLTVKHPDFYGASIIMQGYFRPDFGVGYAPFGPKSAQFKSYDLVHIALTKPPAVSLWILASKQDSLSYPSTAQLVKGARPPLSVTAVLLKQGGHRADIWVPRIPQALSWLGRTLPGFTPAGGQAKPSKSAHPKATTSSTRRRAHGANPLSAQLAQPTYATPLPRRRQG